ncbi:MAG: hypothetical protein ACOH5I_01815 [Oligoflexus sp.]
MTRSQLFSVLVFLVNNWKKFKHKRSTLHQFRYFFDHQENTYFQAKHAIDLCKWDNVK